MRTTRRAPTGSARFDAPRPDAPRLASLYEVIFSYDDDRESDDAG